MTKLSFADDQGQMHFEFIYEGFILGGGMVQQKGIQILRMELNILNKLDSISEPKPCGKKLPNGDAARNLKIGTDPLEFSDAEIDLIRRYMAEVPWSTGTALRNFMETFDWIRIQNEPENKAV